jgi:hypothetical protein
MSAADPALQSVQTAPRPSPWPRLLIVHALQLPALGLVLVSPYAAAWWCAGLWGSAVVCLGTDSGWRWLNRMLVAEAILWLTGTLVFGT